MVPDGAGGGAEEEPTSRPPGLDVHMLEAVVDEEPLEWCEEEIELMFFLWVAAAEDDDAATDDPERRGGACTRRLGTTG